MTEDQKNFFRYAGMSFNATMDAKDVASEENRRLLFTIAALISDVARSEYKKATGRDEIYAWLDI